MNIMPDKKDIILEAATNLFQKYGYSKTSLEDIAGEANLGKGTIYYYFSSKEDMFLEVAQRHADKFYSVLNEKINQEKGFSEKFFTAVSLPIKLVYQHAPILMDAIKTLPENYLQKLDEFREKNRMKILDIITRVFDEGIRQDIINKSFPVDKIVNIVFDWFLLGDPNIIIKNPDEFIKKAEADYELLIHLMLYGIIKRG